MIPEPAQWVMNIGGAVGAALAAIFARRAAANSQSTRHQTKTVEAEMLGPDGEPTIRMLIQQSQHSLSEHRDEMGALFRGLHSDIVDLSDRMHRVEEAVYRGMERRLKKVEDITKESQALSTAVTSLGQQLTSFVILLNRAQANIHKLANVAQVKLFTPEEAEAIKAVLNTVDLPPDLPIDPPKP